MYARLSAHLTSVDLSDISLAELKGALAAGAQTALRPAAQQAQPGGDAGRQPHARSGSSSSSEAACAAAVATASDAPDAGGAAET